MMYSKAIILVALSLVSSNAFVAPKQNSRSQSCISPSIPSFHETQLDAFGLRYLFGLEEPFALAAPSTPDISEGQVRSMFYLWNNALATDNSRIVAGLYAPDAVLLPTVSDIPRTTFDDIKDYFDNFLKNKPQGIILEGTIKIGDGWAKDVGIYEFTMGKDGSKVKARYSFIYVYSEGKWRISHHHSSMMPEGLIVTPRISKDKVQNLFYLWNDALATLDSDAVAKRYSKNAVLLPTVSDTPRTDYRSIKDYFDNFLKLKPQGKIVESYVTTGSNWAKDVGIYEFTMGKDGSKVRARYSFVYVYEDGVWKINHHHSSAMPESLQKAPAGPKITKEEAKGLFNLWNDALATLDPDTVATRYSKNAVLLPTVSDIPRTDYESIKDYFVNFLKLKPQGKILESYVQVGEGWAKDVGTYEFVMGSNGSKVKARYSFVYIFENGQWKISHHHSSAMPEAMLSAGKANESKETKSTTTNAKKETINGVKEVKVVVVKK